MDTPLPRLIGIAGVKQITSLGRTSIYEAIGRGEFKPLKLGRKTVFCESEIVAWVNARLAERQSVSADKAA